MDPHASRPAGWRPHLSAAWRAFWTTRLLIWVAGVGAAVFLGVSRRREDFDPPGLTRPFGDVGDALVAPGARWDSYWFLEIAHSGYDSVRAAFFPLYPLLIAPADALGSAALLLAGLALSCVCFVLALAVLHRLAALELGDEAARWTIVAVALFPMSFYFSAIYSESLYLLLSVGAFYAARTDRWAAAGILGALAATTRTSGILLAPALLLMWWASERRRAADAVWLALVPLGLCAYSLGLSLAGEPWDAPFRAQSTWMREFAGPFGAIADGAQAAWLGTRQLLSGSDHPVLFAAGGADALRVARHNVELFAYLLLAIPALVGAARRLAPAYHAYVLMALALPLSYPVAAQPLMSLPRFEAVLFPLFMWLGLWLSHAGPWLRRAVLGVSAALLVLSVARFSTWHFVA